MGISGKWIWYQNKRLYKKPAFVAFLLAILLFALTAAALSRGESGIYRILLVGCEKSGIAAAGVSPANTAVGVGLSYFIL